MTSLFGYLTSIFCNNRDTVYATSFTFCILHLLLVSKINAQNKKYGLAKLTIFLIENCELKNWNFSFLWIKEHLFHQKQWNMFSIVLSKNHRHLKLPSRQMALSGDLRCRSGLHRCRWRMLEPVCVSDKSAMLMIDSLCCHQYRIERTKSPMWWYCHYNLKSVNIKKSPTSLSPSRCDFQEKTPKNPRNLAIMISP